MLGADTLDKLKVHYHKEVRAHMVYQCFAYYFSQPLVNLPGIAAHFQKEADAEWTHAHAFANFILSKLLTAKVPVTFGSSDPVTFEGTILQALEAAEALETEVLVSLEGIYHSTENPIVHSFLDTYIREQYVSLEEIARLIATVKTCKDEWQLKQFDNTLTTNTV